MQPAIFHIALSIFQEYIKTVNPVEWLKLFGAFAFIVMLSGCATNGPKSPANYDLYSNQRQEIKPPVQHAHTAPVAIPLY
ncbi:MAG: hypothetical protein WD077_11280 [Bacteroidia bacterium]